MQRSITIIALAVLLLGTGVVAGRFTAPTERTDGEADTPASGTVAPPAPARDEPPLELLGRPDPATRNHELDVLQGALEASRAERDRLQAEIATWRDQAKRWDALVEFERVQRAFNETAAIAATRNAISASAQVQVTGRIDEDRDGVGEYAGFLEMSGGAVGRIAGGKPLTPPVLSSSFQTLTVHGEAYRSGYLFRLFLPDARGNGVGEGRDGFLLAQVDPDLAETTWCMYAWPAVGGEAGQRTSFTNQSGDVLVTVDPRYSGPGGGPPSDAAFRRPGITGPAAIGATGNDGNTWTPVN